MQGRTATEEFYAYFQHIKDACTAFEAMSERQREQLRALIKSGQDITDPQAWEGVTERNDKATRDYAAATKAAENAYTNATAAGRGKIDRAAQIIRNYKDYSPSLKGFFSIFCEAVSAFWDGTLADRESTTAPEAEQTPTAKKINATFDAAKEAYKTLTKEEQAEADKYLQFFEEVYIERARA